MNLNTNEIRSRFISFFQKRSHSILESSSLVTSDEKTETDSTLFNTAGVQPLIPFLLGENHPKGRRLASAQKCIRTIDIEEVGDKTHLTFFEMLGNWSLGDYFKKEAIDWSYEFLTSTSEGLGLDPKRIYITVFGGNEFSEKDVEAGSFWKNHVEESRIFYLESNWWEAGENGPCGPDTEIFYDITTEGLGNLSHSEFLDADSKQKVVEIWNNVFMQFRKENNVVKEKLDQHAVDTGAGLERLAVVVNGLESIYGSDNFLPLMSLVKNNSCLYNEKSSRIICDHLRAAIFLISDGISPSNSHRGYILRRIIRRAVRHCHLIKLENSFINDFIELVQKQYEKIYEIDTNYTIKIIQEEVKKFEITLVQGIKEFERVLDRNNKITGADAFKLFSTYGFPIELVQELAKEKNVILNLQDFKKELANHQEKSRTSSAGMFKGGLVGKGEQEKKLHTATHLLHKSLKLVLGEHIQQKGSNINAERLRFDFSHNEKMTDEQRKQVEEIVNKKIKEGLPVQNVQMNLKDAIKTGADHLFSEKYPDKVSIYFTGNSLESAFSKEFCGGPHVENLAELGTFKILKEEASSAGIRRIKAILE